MYHEEIYRCQIPRVVYFADTDLDRLSSSHCSFDLDSAYLCLHFRLAALGNDEVIPGHFKVVCLCGSRWWVVESPLRCVTRSDPQRAGRGFGG
jgi:hypothetical protein